MLAHEGEGLSATEVIVTRIRGAAFPHSGIGVRDEIRFEFLEVFLFLLVGHVPFVICVGHI